MTAYNVSGAMSAPFGQTTVPPSMKYRAKNSGDFERLKHRPVKPLGKIDRVLGSIVEDHAQAEATSVLSLDDARKKFHGFFWESGAMLSSGCPAFIFAQFASNSFTRLTTNGMPLDPKGSLACALRQWRILASRCDFVETPIFTAPLQRHLDDEQYQQLQIALTLRPETSAQARVLGRLVREEFK